MPTRSSGEAASARERSQAARQRELERKAAEADQIRAAVPSILEMLEAWLTFHRQSPLDGTISCRICRAMVLEENCDSHYAWHDTHRQQHEAHYGRPI